MSKLELKICAGIGDNIVLRMALDTVKHKYDEIRIAHNKAVIEAHRGPGMEYYAFLQDLGTLLFSEPPYIFDRGEYPEIHTCALYQSLGIAIKKPNLDYLLCKGTPLNLGQEYLTISTKARTFLKLAITPEFWEVLRSLSKKYMVVILGEQVIDCDRGIIGTGDEISSIYHQILANLDKDRILDLTSNKLSTSSFKLDKVQQDCLLMKNAKLSINFGIGGNVWMSAAVANTLGFRTDNEAITNIVVNPQFSNLFLTKDWGSFIGRLREYLS